MAPWNALAERVPTLDAVHGLGAEKGDAHRDGDLHRRAGQGDPAECGCRQRDRVRNGEGSEGQQQLFRAHQEDHAQHEQEMVPAEDDVLHADPEIGDHRCAGGDGEVQHGGGWTQHGTNIIALQPVDANECVCQGSLQPIDPDHALIEITARRPSLHQRPAGRGDIFAFARAGVWKDRIDLQAPSIQHRLFPCDVIYARGCLDHFQIGRTHFMRRCRRRGHQPDGEPCEAGRQPADQTGAIRH
jgi:hypothetical protein